MSLKNCVKLKKKLDPDDRAAFDAEYDDIVKGGIPKEDAYSLAAETMIENILGERNFLSGEVMQQNGYIEPLSFENIVNPASYKPVTKATAADIGKVSAADFDAMMEDSSPTKKGNAVPAEPEPKKPKKMSTEGEASMYIRMRTGKKINRSKVTDLRIVAKAAGIEGQSKMNKEELITALRAWQEARAIGMLPDPSPTAAQDLRAAYYTRADTGVGVVVSSTDPAMANWARHYGASVEKKAQMFTDSKTAKGYHFQGTTDFIDFVKAYTGLTFKDNNVMDNGGEPVHVYYQEEQTSDPSEAYVVGDKVNIMRHGVSGEVIDIEIDPVDGRPMYTVKFEDTDGQVFEEMYDATSLERAERAPLRKGAGDILKEAAKHGVSGADEALTGLANLFGGKSKFSSGFTFDEETYAKAKPHFKKALEEFVAAGKSLKEFVDYILGNFGDGIKPYLKQFHTDISDDSIEIRGINDVQPPTQEPTAVSAVSAQPADPGDIADAGARDAEVSVETDQRPTTEEGIEISSIGLPVDSTATVGEQGDLGILGETGEFSTTHVTPRLSDTRRGGVTGAERVLPESPGSKGAIANAQETGKRLNLRPTTSTWIQSDPANIAESLPQLFPEQQDDVLFAEQRIFDNGHRGVLFTNGTGTGKTFTGLGLVKRMVMQGKDSILVTVPGEKVAADWIKAGKALGLNITKLKGIKDHGQGIVITTYANMAENDEIVKRNWDLVIHDEAHKLSENAAGAATNALNKSRALTGHPDGSFQYAESMERELLDDIATVRAQIKDFGEQAAAALDRGNNTKAGELQQRATASEERHEALYSEWVERSAEHRRNRADLWATKEVKRLDLSATPFAYDKSVDHAEGFLFEYDRTLEEQSRGYNQPNAHDSFFVEHFGYRMRYGKLTQPEAEVDSALMQRQFNTWLKDQGALRGRRLTVDHDYSREFVAIDDLVGTKIDEGLDLIRDRAGDKDNSNQLGWEIMRKKLNKHFNYHARVKMLEAIKAGHAVTRAREHMALGRKVVIYHSRIQGGTVNPFAQFVPTQSLGEDYTEGFSLEMMAAELQAYNDAVAEFNAERKDLVTLEINQTRPLDLFEQEFGEQMTVYNGTISNKDKRENPDKFNQDDTPIQIIVVQDQGGKEGISLHDATGANQRVLMNLGLPVQPTQAIQIEGRIYRVGQQSNAIFEYFNTGTSFERITFAGKISERASTAENLALGEEARSLKDSFIDAFEDPSFAAPTESQGVGGKDIDLANWGAVTEFDRAKTHYFGTLKTKGKRGERAGVDYFATPEPVGLKMVEWAGIRPNDAVLEPSAGHGAIGRYFPENVSATYIEPSSELLSRLALRAPGNHRQMQFEDLDIGGNKFDAIVMNPPFGSGGATAMAHLQKAMHHLKNGGRVVALIPEGPAADKKFENLFYGKEGELEALREKVKAKRKAGQSFATETRRIEDLTKFHLRADISLPPITFTRAGTAIRAHVVVIDKVLNDQITLVNQPKRELHADTVSELFDKVEGMNTPDRTERVQSPAEYLEAQGLIVKPDPANQQFTIEGKTFEHKELIKKALDLTGTSFDRALQAWITKENPTDALYQEFTAPEAAKEAREVAATPDDMAAAAAALFTGREGKLPDALPSTPSALGGLTVTEGKTKNDKQVWEVTGNTREHKDLLKSLGGRWYGPKKAWSFYNADPTESIASKLEKPQALRDRRKGGSTPAQVKEWLKTPLRRISGRVPVTVVRKSSDIKTDQELASDALGWLIDGRVYLVADNIRDIKDAHIALTHEAVGHLGLEGVLGKRKFNELVGDIMNMKVEEMLAPGTHPELARIIGMLREAYVDESGKYALSARDEVKEILAHIAQSKSRIGMFVEIRNKIINWFRQQLAKWGFVNPDMANIEDALIRATDFIKTPPGYYTGRDDSGAVAMRAWHGGANIFDKFKTAFVGRGEGFQAFGWGLYFGSERAVGEYYRTAGAFDAGRLVRRHGEVRAIHGMQNQIDKARAFAAPNMEYIEKRERIIDQIRSGAYKGNVYEVELAPTDEEFMRWNDPFESQPQVVQEAILLLLGNTSAYYEGLRMTGEDMYKKLARAIKNKDQDISTKIQQILGFDPYDLHPDAEPYQVASMALHALGVRGNKYIAEQLGVGARGKPGSYNYVAFSEDDVTITEREGPAEPAKPLAMRPPPDEPSATEKEAFRKMGLAGKKTLWQRINNMRLKVIVETLDAMAGRGYEGLFDGLIELKRKEIEAGVGIGVNDYENSAYVSARLATGVADMMTHVLHHGPLQWNGGVASPVENTRGLLDLFGDLGVEKLNDWLLWMGANRAQQLMSEGRERNLTPDEIAVGLGKAKGQEELFNRIKNEYAAMNKLMLNFAEEAGLIDPVKRAEWESDFYVPFYRISEDEMTGPRVKRGLSHQNAGIRRLFGAEIPTNDLLENILANWLKLTDASVKNHALRLMVDNFEGKTDGNNQEYISHETMRFTKALVPKSEIRKRILQDRAFAKQVADFLGLDMDQPMLNPDTGEMEQVNTLDLINEVNKIPGSGFEQLWALTAPKDPDIVQLKRNGKNEYWRVHVPGLLRAVGHMDETGSSNLGMRAARWFKRILTTGVTASPDFMLRNFIRDAAHAWAINKDNMWFGVDAIKGLGKAMEESPTYVAMLAAGASFQGGYVHATDPQASAQIMRRELEKAGLTDAAIHAHLGSVINTPAKLKALALQGWQHYRTVGDKIENANRIATAEAGIKAGKPTAQWLFESKDLMDYSRRGNFALLIAFTDVIPFLNARMQGVDKLGRAVKADPVIVGRKMAMIGAFSVALAMLNDDDDRYQELPDWEKDAYWHFWIDIGGPTDGHYRIPKPFEIGIIAGTIPERMYRTWVTGSQPSEKLKWSILHGTLETLNVNPIPQFALPIVEVAANRSFYFAQPIESLSDEGVIPKERFNAYTSNTAIALGDVALAEWIGVSPKQLQHIWNGYTGTMGAYFLKVVDMGVRSIGDQPGRAATQAHDIPIVRSIYQGERIKGTQWQTDFYDRIQEVRELHATMNKYLTERDKPKATAFRLEHGKKLKWRKALESRAKIFGQLRRRRDAILRDDKLSPTEKYQKSQEIQARINEIAKKIEAQSRAAFSE